MFFFLSSFSTFLKNFAFRRETKARVQAFPILFYRHFTGGGETVCVSNHCILVPFTDWYNARPYQSVNATYANNRYYCDSHTNHITTCISRRQKTVFSFQPGGT